MRWHKSHKQRVCLRSWETRTLLSRCIWKSLVFVFPWRIHIEKQRQGVIVIFRKRRFWSLLVGGKERQFASYGDLIRFPLQSCSEMPCFFPPLVYCSLILFKPQHVLRITELHWCLVRLKIHWIRMGNTTPHKLHLIKKSSYNSYKWIIKGDTFIDKRVSDNIHPM